MYRVFGWSIEVPDGQFEVNPDTNRLDVNKVSDFLDATAAWPDLSDGEEFEAEREFVAITECPETAEAPQ
jgi:hypothetical protein